MRHSHSFNSRLRVGEPRVARSIKAKARSYSTSMLAILSDNSDGVETHRLAVDQHDVARKCRSPCSAARHRPRHDARRNVEEGLRAGRQRGRQRSGHRRVEPFALLAELAYVGGDGSLVILRPEKPLTAARLSCSRQCACRARSSCRG